MEITRIKPNQKLQKRNDRTGIEHYLKILRFLKNKGILTGCALYPLIGFDFFPALFTKVFGFNNRHLSQFAFFPNQIRKLGIKPAGWTQRLKRNLNYIGGRDSRNVQKMEGELRTQGFFKLPGKKILLLKGTLVDLFEKEFDSNTERYYKCTEPMKNAASWLALVLKLFSPGDQIIAFDRDIEMIPQRGCTRINLPFPIKAIPSENSFFIETGETAATLLHLPSKFQVFRIDR